MTHSVRSLCVYCGSRFGNNPVHKEGARALGQLIGEAGMTLVYGAGSIGLMGTVAQAAMQAGAPVIGVIPKHLDDIEITQTGMSETHITDTMHERKKLMFDRSDAFIVLPGGFGTMDEAFEIITWAQLGLHQKPIILLDQEGYWAPFLALLNHIVDEGFASEKNRSLYTIVTRAEEAINYLKNLSISDEKNQSALF